MTAKGEHIRVSGCEMHHLGRGGVLIDGGEAMKRAGITPIVLGAKVRSDGPSVSLQDRIDAAYDYMRLHPEVICIVSGGQGKDEPISEAQCMFDRLVGKQGLVKAFLGGCREVWELAEWFGVPAEFMAAALRSYRARFGTFTTVKIGGKTYSLAFEPTLHVECLGA